MWCNICVKQTINVQLLFFDSRYHALLKILADKWQSSSEKWQHMCAGRDSAVTTAQLGRHVHPIIRQIFSLNVLHFSPEFLLITTKIPYRKSPLLFSPNVHPWSQARISAKYHQTSITPAPTGENTGQVLSLANGLARKRVGTDENACQWYYFAGQLRKINSRFTETFEIFCRFSPLLTIARVSPRILIDGQGKVNYEKKKKYKLVMLRQ